MNHQLPHQITGAHTRTLVREHYTHFTYIMLNPVKLKACIKGTVDKKWYKSLLLYHDRYKY